MVEVSKDQFINFIYPKICSDKQAIKLLFKTIYEQRTLRHDIAIEDSCVLSDIEDFALQYKQNNVKLFLFGQACKYERCFEQEIAEKEGQE